MVGETRGGCYETRGGDLEPLSRQGVTNRTHCTDGFGGIRRQTDMAHKRQSRPDSGLGFQVKVLEIVDVVPSLHGCESSATLVG